MLKAITRSSRAVDARVATINAERAASNNFLDQQKKPPPITVAQFFDHHAEPSDYAVEVREEDFLSAKNELVPSVSVEELGHYEKVRQSFEGAGDKIESTRTVNGGGVVDASNDGAGEGTSRDKGKGKARALEPPTWTSDQRDMEAWQAAKIEELMRSGFDDGSLARNDPRPGRPGGEAGGVNGKGKGKAMVEPEGEGEGENGDYGSDFVRRTQEMGLNGDGDVSNGVDEERRSKGKGKARAEDIDDDSLAQTNGGFGNAAMDEELY